MRRNHPGISYADLYQLASVVAVKSAGGRGLHSSTSQLNLSTFYGIGGARRGCVARFKGVFRVCRVCRVFMCVRHDLS